ncbi:hypothetical protein [Flavobacterium flavipallidum]|uniref:Uncharacterized protein n=1 Tax=Flavobacterium flavipallidum TaxID=3139140 RepID=A0ABU9HLB0_9FLAO
MKKDLTRTTRGIAHFLNLKSDFEDDSDRIFSSLPLFYRIMYIDQPNPWVNQINRFDFIRLAVVSSNFKAYQLIKIGNFEYKKITPSNKVDILEIDLSDFFNSSILRTDEYEYSVQDFIMGLAYNGGIHMKPDKNIEKIEFLYENLFIKLPDLAYNITKSISKVLLEIFDEMYSLLVGDNNGHSPNINFQAKIMKAGVLLDGILFEKAYMQFPIRAKKDKGIRICLQLKLESDKISGPILYYGHRKNDSLQVGITQNSKMLIIHIMSQVKKIITYNIQDLVSTFFLLELAIYPTGEILLAINKMIKVAENVNKPIEIIDGKVILGSDLNGKNFGYFSEKTIVIQSIDKYSLTMNLGVYSLTKIDIEQKILPYNLIYREI